ncbi:hypothetical protein JCM18899A_20090 [Nocardioides sp. AN3]
MKDIDAHALRRAGRASAIARHLGRDRTTIRPYLAGERVAGTSGSVIVITVADVIFTTTPFPTASPTPV